MAIQYSAAVDLPNNGLGMAHPTATPTFTKTTTHRFSPRYEWRRVGVFGRTIADLKSLVLLHSNDMHGDFFAEDAEGLRVGGVSLRSGYVQQVRREHRNTSFAVAGDMVQGSVIDAGFRGLSTINLMLRHRSAVPGIADCYRLSVAFSVTT
ncbi:MAG: hypothetical protein LBH11_03685 [Propionibacteriaceae bacterium]|nr:hypothetical protein [Propionibacteriaceae bacterium]